MFQLSPNADGLARLMDASDLRHRVISHNLANVNTPGYHRMDVDFEQALAQHMREANPGSEMPQPTVFEEQGLQARTDGNNVDIDREIGELNRNAMLFQTYSQLLAVQLDQMRRATRGV